MRQIASNIILSFIFITQAMWFVGCTRTVQTMKVVCDCPNEKFECVIDERIFNVDGK